MRRLGHGWSRRRPRCARSGAGTVAALLAGSALLAAPAAAGAAPPDGRAYEQTTPANKNGATFGMQSGADDLVQAAAAGVIARDGDRVQTDALSAFGETDPGSGISRVSHVLERTATGWRSRALPPAIDPDVLPIDFSGVFKAPRGTTPDLRRMLYSSVFNLDPRDRDSGTGTTTNDIYDVRLEPTRHTIALLSCAPAPAPPCAEPIAARDPESGVNTLSADGSTAQFETAEPFLGASGPQIYARAGAGLRWISQPLEAPLPAGATQLSGTPSMGASVSTNAGQPNTPGPVGAWPNAITRDGSRAFFASPTGGDVASRIYVRVGDRRTLELSRVRGGDATAQKVKFRGASPSGDRALISTQQALLPAAGDSALASDPNAVEDLYLWTYDEGQDPGNDAAAALTRIAGLPQTGPGPSPDGQVALSVLGASDDLTRVYLLTRTAQSPFEANLYVVELPSGDPRSGSLRWIAKPFSATSANATYGGCLNPANGVSWSTCARASADGRYLAFDSPLPLTADDQEPDCVPAGAIPAACKQDVYRYDAERDTLTRASRGADGHDGEPLDATLFGGAGVPSTNSAPRRAQHISSGGEVFFVTTAALAAQDGNGRQDVYASDGGAAKLISSGASPLNSLYVGASDDGRDVFFITTEGLVPDDTDGAPDIYDARVGGGFDRSKPPRCDALADGCQGPGVPPATPSPRTDQPGVDGNVKSPARRRLLVSRPSSKARAAVARSGRLAFTVRSTVPGTIGAQARGRIGKRSRTLARGSLKLAKAGAGTLRMKVSRATRTRLRRGHAVRLRIQVKLAGARTQAITVRVPGVRR